LEEKEVMDKKHKKNLKRKAKNKKLKQKSEEAQRRMQKQINLFDKLPNVCSTCSTNFPKTKEAHMNWKVVVKAKNEMVRLFCPDCQEKAKELVEKQNEV
jgi:hypothetical protein